ncbi:hypothetical protein AB0A77_27330 [Streptomyces varsoviensis]
MSGCPSGFTYGSRTTEAKINGNGKTEVEVEPGSTGPRTGS